MKKLFPFAAAAAAGAALAALAGPAAAAVPARQSFRCVAGRTAFADNVDAKSGSPLARYSAMGPASFLFLKGVMDKPGRDGAGSRTSFDLTFVNPGNPNSTNYPVRIVAGGATAFVGGMYTSSVTKDVLKGPDVQLETTTTVWQVDAAGAPAFAVDLLKWDGATRRLSGKFSGTLRAADGAPAEQKPLKLRGGKFSATVAFEGM